MRKLLILASIIVSIVVCFASSSVWSAPQEAECPPSAQENPLDGVDLLAPWDEVVLAWDRGDASCAKVYDVTPDKRFLPGGWICDPSSLADKRHLDVATGDFNGDNRDEFVWIWQSDLFFPRPLILRIVAVDDDLQQYLPCDRPGTGENVYGHAHLAVATGDFEGDGADEIAVAWEGDTTEHRANIKIYDVSDSLCFEARDKDYMNNDLGVNTQRYLDVATGDFDGDGTAEAALLWEGDSYSVNVKVYDVDANLILEPKGQMADEFVSGGEHMAFATGDFDGDKKAEIAVVWEQETEEEDEAQRKVFVTLKIYDVEPKLDGSVQPLQLITRQKKSFTDIMVDRIGDLDIQAGDFDGNGDDEIVFSFSGREGEIRKVHTFVIDVGTNWQLIKRDHNQELAVSGNMDIDLATGNFDLEDLEEEVVLALEHEPNKACRVLYDTPRAGFTLQRVDGPICDESLGGKKHLAVAAGNFDGDGFHLGPPTEESPQCTQAQHIIAYISEPPKHEDVVNSERYNINNNIESYVSYRNEQSQSTEMLLTTWTDWGLSSELEAGYATITGWLEIEFGAHFEKRTEQSYGRIHRERFGKEVLAQADDVLITIENEYAIWEYPVYTDTVTSTIGHMAVVVPLRGPRTVTMNGRNAAAFRSYLPSHENGNVLSYPSEPPPDEQVGDWLWRDEAFNVGVNPYSSWVCWSDLVSAGRSVSSALKFELGIGGGGVFPLWSGIGVLNIDVRGEYSRGQIESHSISFMEDSCISLHLAAIQDEDQSYQVSPYYYWSDIGALVVDYDARPVMASAGFPATWWDRVYDKPDLTFNLPWRWGSDEDKRELSREITLNPEIVTAGETQAITITAAIHNYSLVPTDTIRVRFYQGDPREGGNEIGQPQMIGELPARGSAVVTTTAEIVVSAPSERAALEGRARRALVTSAGITAPADEHRIFVVVDPGSECPEGDVPKEGDIPEIDECDNRAFRNLVVKAADAPMGDAFISSEDISFERIAPDHIEIKGNVHAKDGPVAFVLVEFYDGDPQGGGEFIDADEIPLILPETQAVAQVAWDVTGQYGYHNIYAVIAFNPEEDSNPDNNAASRGIRVTPFNHQIYLPIVIK